MSTLQHIGHPARRTGLALVAAAAAALAAVLVVIALASGSGSSASGVKLVRVSHASGQVIGVRSHFPPAARPIQQASGQVIGVRSHFPAAAARVTDHRMRPER